MSDLLPPNATGAERAMSVATSRAADVPVPVGDLWNPQTCPAAVLPWLAWALSVDIWDADWSEADKRAAIAASIAIHRRKGTVWASREALRGAINDAVLTEWPQYGGSPYCYRIETTGGLVDTETYHNKLLPAIWAAKNVRSHLDRIIVKRTLTGELKFKFAMFTRCTTKICPQVALNQIHSVYIGVALQVGTRLTIRQA